MMFCMKCGTELPDDARFCYKCGNSINIEIKKKDNMVNSNHEHDEPNKEPKQKTELQKVTFLLADGVSVSYNKNLQQCAALFGEFLAISETTADYLLDEYRKCNNMMAVLQKIPDLAQSEIELTLEYCLKILYENNIHMSAEQFIKKYYYQFKIDYEPYYRTALDKYAEICNQKQELDAFRMAQKASRSRWEGGGFGVKGAIKGAVTASAMNIGMDFVRSFGDNATSRKDNEKFVAQLDELYNDAQIRANLCRGVRPCIMNAYYSLINELGEHNVMHIKNFERNDALVLFENTNKFEKDRHKIVSKVVECILLYPGEKKFYEEIMPEILSQKNSQFEQFMEFWGISFLFPEYAKKKKQLEELEELAELEELDKCSSEFDRVYLEYKNQYIEKYGEINEVTSKLYYEMIRPAVNEYYTKQGFYEGKLGERYCVIPEESEYINEIKGYVDIIRENDFDSKEYFDNMPDFDSIMNCIRFVSSVDEYYIGDLDLSFMFDGNCNYQLDNNLYQSVCNRKVRNSLRDMKQEIILYKHCDLVGVFEKPVDFIIITSNYLILPDLNKSRNYCFLDARKIKSIKLEGKKILVSDDSETGYILYEYECWKDPSIKAFMVVLYYIYTKFYGCQISIQW